MYEYHMVKLSLHKETFVFGVLQETHKTRTTLPVILQGKERTNKS